MFADISLGQRKVKQTFLLK